MTPDTQPHQSWEFWIDVGGTFTDCIAIGPDGALRTHKLLSTGVYGGRVAAGSTRLALLDPHRRSDPDGFFSGWRLRLLQDTGSGADTTRAGTAGGLSHSDRAVRTAPIDEQAARVTRFDRCDGRLVLQPALACSPQPGQRYELHCDEEAPVVGIRWLLGKSLCESVGRVRVQLGTTRGTNALLERRGARTAFITTSGFADVLRIGTQQRPHLFDLHIRVPRPLYECVVEIDERVSGSGEVLRGLDERQVTHELRRLKAEGIESLAICLLNSYRNPAHERRIGEIARQLGMEHVSCSTDLAPVQRLVPRGETTVVNAYVAPIIEDYLAKLRRSLPDAQLKVMTSAGALTAATTLAAKDTLLSGPAAGVVGAAHLARMERCPQSIAFDMGGTSTDVSRYAGRLERRFEMGIEDRETGGSLRLFAPVMSIETVAAGGGSICDFDGIKPTVGPRSAGADPGPACYGRGGPLCITDANVCLGRVPDDLFPFPLDRQAAQSRLADLVVRIAAATGRRYGRQELAAGYVEIANAQMAAAIRKVSVQRGYDPREHLLVAFGGAGGQHACALAGILGIRRVLLHPLAGLLSAYGIGMAEVARFAARDVGRPLEPELIQELRPLFAETESQLRREIEDEGIAPGQIRRPLHRLDLRYEGQDATLTIDEPPDADWAAAFERRHQQLYGFAHPGRPIEVRVLRVELAGETPKRELPAPSGRTGDPTPLRTAAVFFERGPAPTPIFRRDDLHPGEACAGPALILEPTGTVVVEPGWKASMSPSGNLLLDQLTQTQRGSVATSTSEPHREPCDPITLELFNRRFEAVAEQMGATLQKTALSTNVKERLDFSCAVYDAQGGLVSHAPHIPVHIGAMGACVLNLIEATRRAGAQVRPGEVYITNDPYRGGSHLPDVTVITPVFDEHNASTLFYVANRAHHAEIGGAAPGSMPPRSRTLVEEGVRIPLMPVAVAHGAGDREHAPRAGDGLQIRDEALRRLLSDGPYPSRSVHENLADIRAQIAANHCGSRLLRAMTRERELPVVRAYMGHLQSAAEAKMRAALRRLPEGRRGFVDHLDDGTPIAVNVTIAGGSAVVDFAGTGEVHPENLNATPAIVASAVLYCFRCLVAEDIPLNAGVLAPLTIHVPAGLLNPPAHDDPARCAAVAGGNVETSQRIVDAIFGALGVVAASQGTMNNFTFGNDRFGYYETIAGGSGAGPGFVGAGAVHTHMTNTRLTDAEVLEDRYPVRLRRFGIRRGSGGRGARRGGDGLIREIEFLEPLEVSLLTQRRTRQPYGLAGGGPGAAGENLLIRRDGSTEDLGPTAQLRVAAGEILRISTPGGGGYGECRS